MARGYTVGGMAVNLTKIYTKTGDDGTTGLADFSRVPKTHPRLAAYGDVDEVNAAVGCALALGGAEVTERMTEVLLAVQNDLFDVGADLSTPWWRIRSTRRCGSTRST
ncbi:hypothetical protein GCM10029992_22340 [Glycomyces albus]